MEYENEAAFDAELARRAEEIKSGKEVCEPVEKVIEELRIKYGRSAMPTRPRRENHPQRET